MKMPKYLRRTRHDMGLMGKRDFDNYYRFFETLKTMR